MRGDVLTALWDRFWFSAESPQNLAAARIILATHALWLLLSRDLPALSGLPPDFWSTVPASAHWRYLIWEGHPDLERTLEHVAIAALVAAIVGLRPRTSCFVAALLLYRLGPLETLFYFPAPWIKGLTLSVTGLLVLALGRSGDAFCLVPSRRASRKDVPPWEYGWPLRLVQLFLCQAYLFSGYAKLVRAGFAWASADSMRNWLLHGAQDVQPVVFGALGHWVAASPTLCLLAGVGALAIDLGFIAALFSRRARLWLVPAAVVFHAGIFFTMNYAFLNTPQLLIFVDWDAVRARIARSGTRCSYSGSPVA